MTSRDIYFYVAGLGTAAIFAFGLWLYGEWQDYRDWLERERRGR